MKNIPKILLIIFLVIFILQMLALLVLTLAPLFASAEEKEKTEPVRDMSCWDRALCEKHNGIFEEEEAACGEGWGRCYPKTTSTELQIQLQGREEVTDVAEYIALLYRYAVGVGAILAVVMIIWGGVVYLTAGGLPERITQAKEYISNAIIGLVLLYTSYLLLQTINPDLVRLRMPRVYMIRPIPYECCLDKKTGETKFKAGCDEKLEKSVNAAICEYGYMEEGSPCLTIRDKEKCETSCEGCRCVVIPESSIVKFSQEVVDASLLLMGGTTVGTKIIVESAKIVGKLSLGALKFIWKHKTLAAMGTALAVYKTKEGECGERGCGEEGICIKEATNLKNGEICGEDRHCTSQKCLKITETWGTCTDGSPGTFCGGYGGSSIACKQGSTCEPTPEYPDIKICLTAINRENGQPCSSHYQCKSGWCHDVSQRCASLQGAALDEWNKPYCSTDRDCRQPDYVCVRYHEPGSSQNCEKRFEKGSECGADWMCLSQNCRNEICQ